MRPAFPLLFLFLLSLSYSLLHPCTSLCVPRGSRSPSLPSPTSPPPPPPTTSPPPPPTSSPPPPTPSPPPPSAPAKGLDDALKSFCSHTDFSDLCLDSIKGLKRADKAAVLSALMRAVDAKAHEARSFAQRLSADPATGAKIRDLLRDCIDTYDDALDNLEAANEAVRAGDAGTRDAMLSAMISNFGTCEDGFQEFTVKSPMAQWSQTLQNMTDNCLAIFNMDRPNEDYE
ncbi:hypothetical protein HPP92_027565 [Vanilla planifolia]|uniref:Pectinesterase inhibitor domain-containing protein n=1 Tax=Vanilla planifolia TaxID=51239 RepID=A0A835U5U9_VANPL|nr:hypothetical protein HPP92_027565 [Vanilla planifolia]